MSQLQVSYSFYNHHSLDEGVILRVEDKDGNFGVANIHPLLHLGDLPLREEIRVIGPLYQRALELALDDLHARTEKQILCDSQPIENHVLVKNWRQFEVESFSNEKVYKFKCGTDFLDFAIWLNSNVSKFSTIRIDFNAQLSSAQFEEFLRILKPEVIQKINLVEDPTPFDIKSWTEFSKKVSLASDFEKPNNESIRWPIRINKPSREAYDPENKYTTSSMDHPIGHVHAMRFAKKNPQAKHGFLTILSYKDSDYYLDFSIQSEKIQYFGKGFGIGFDRQISKENFVPEINWDQTQDTLLILDPAALMDIRSQAFETLKIFIKQHPKDFILVASSGSSTSLNDIKLYAFTKEAFLNAAERVIRHFKIPKNIRWGCVLPFHHVAGLSALARAYVTDSNFAVNTWQQVTPEWFSEKGIQAISLVPAQVYDVVQKNWSAPKCLKYVFVGAGQLSQNIYQKAIALGWPLRLTYGMTETIGMIAELQNYSTDPVYILMDGVKIKDAEGAKVQVSSQATYQIMSRTDQTEIQKIVDLDGYIKLPDQVELSSSSSFKVIGRWDDQIKIKGELVQLGKIKKLFTSLYSDNFEIIALKHLRNGYQLVLVLELSETESALLDVRNWLQNLNDQLQTFEQVKKFIFITDFPKTSLLKNRVQEIKALVQKKMEEGLIYEIGKF